MGPCLFLNTRSFVFTRRPAAEVHQGLKWRQGRAHIRSQIPEVKSLSYSVSGDGQGKDWFEKERDAFSQDTGLTVLDTLSLYSLGCLAGVILKALALGT